MSSTESDSESARDFPRSVEEEEKTENGNSHEENGNFMEENGPSSRRSPGRASKSASLFSLAFPISRVRKLVKSEGEIQWVGVEAGFLIAKAAELFLEKFVEDAFDRMQDKKRACVAYSDLSSCGGHRETGVSGRLCTRENVGVKYSTWESYGGKVRHLSKRAW